MTVRVPLSNAPSNFARLRITLVRRILRGAAGLDFHTWETTNLDPPSPFSQPKYAQD